VAIHEVACAGAEADPGVEFERDDVAPTQPFAPGQCLAGDETAVCRRRGEARRTHLRPLKTPERDGGLNLAREARRRFAAAPCCAVGVPGNWAVIADVKFRKFSNRNGHE